MLARFLSRGLLSNSPAAVSQISREFRPVCVTRPSAIKSAKPKKAGR